MADSRQVPAEVTRMTLTTASAATPAPSPTGGVAEGVVDAAVVGGAPADVAVLRTDLTDAEFRALWRRLQAVQP
jgi:hypothetical protein